MISCHPEVAAFAIEGSVHLLTALALPAGA